jgi:hypothetical protein
VKHLTIRNISSGWNLSSHCRALSGNVLSVDKKNISTKTKLSEKYAGMLPIKIAEDLQNHIEQSRNEWDSKRSHPIAC